MRFGKGAEVLGLNLSPAGVEVRILGERQTLLLLIPVPGTEGARSVIVRVRSLRP